MKLIAVHGFGGHPDDWDTFFEQFNLLRNSQSKNSQVQNPPLKCPKSEALDIYKMLREIAENSNDSESVWEKLTKTLMGLVDDHQVLWIGYSMGARILLPLIELRPQDYFVFVSAHPGLESSIDKEARRDLDDSRSRELSVISNEDEWKKWFESWNSQPVLAPSQSVSPQQIKRIEFKNDVANSMTLFSLGRQKSYKQIINLESHRLLWVTGSNDTKFSVIARQLKAEAPHLQWDEIEGAGHRIPLTHASLLAESVARFLNQRGHNYV